VSAASLAVKPTSDMAVGGRLCHRKFGGVVAPIDGNKLEVDSTTPAANG